MNEVDVPSLPDAVLIAGMAALVGATAGAWLARLVARLITQDATAVPSRLRVVVTQVGLALALSAALLFSGFRPAAAGFACVAVAALVLGPVDLASHRLPDRVTYPAAAVCLAAFAVDAVVLGTWSALLRAVLAAAVVVGVSALTAALSPAGLGFGDVKLLGLLGLVLGWVGWDTLGLGLLLGLVVGSLVALFLLVTGRAGWRTALPFGPPLLAGAAFALALHGPLALA